MRLAWFTPWPPDRHAAARRSRDSAHALVRQGYEIDFFIEPTTSRPADHAPSFAGSIAPASDFAARAADHPYDVAVYQVVNAPAGAFVWPYLLERPGLAVLQETRFYSARSAVARSHPVEFRAEFAWNHPHVSPDAAELAIAGFDGAYTSLWPMLRTVVDSSLAVAVPSPGALRDLQDDWPEAAVVTVAAGIDAPVADVAAGAEARATFGIPDRAVVFGVRGEGDVVGTEARRLPQILRAFASTAARVPDTWLLVVGDVDRRALALPEDLGRTVVVAGPAADDRRAVAAADVWLDLRWPDHGATTDEWLTAIARGCPTITFDRASVSDAPMLDPRTWEPPFDGRDPIGVGVDILDEDHSLRLALYRLAIDGSLRDRLGQAAREYWRQAHTVEHMAADFDRAIHRALTQPVPPAAAGAGVPLAKVPAGRS